MRVGVALGANVAVASYKIEGLVGIAVGAGALLSRSRDTIAQPSPISASANTVLNGDQKVMCLIRNVSHRKTKEEQKYIESQRKKDRVRQNIFKIRSSLKRLNNLSGN